MKETENLLAELRHHFTVTNLFWLIYLSLLGVLLPHAAWAFNHFQRSGETEISWMAWALAFTFEGAVFAFTHRLKDRIEKARRLRCKEGESSLHFGWRKLTAGYLNIHSLGLLSCSGVSGLANFTYAVEFAGEFVIYGQYSVNPLFYELAFGGILPVVSLLFAQILADTIEDEVIRDEALEAAKQAEREAKQRFAQLRQEFERAKGPFAQFRQLQAESARERILAAAQLWPDLSKAGISVIANSSPGYVSEVLKNGHNIELDEQANWVER